MNFRKDRKEKTGKGVHLGGHEEGKIALGVKLLNGCCEIVEIGAYYLESNKIVVLVHHRLMAQLVKEGSLNNAQAECLKQTVEQSLD